MPETVNDKQVFSLLEVTKSIQRTLSERYKSAFWVKAEMNKLNFYRQSGHCYPELVEKKDGKIIAQIKSCLWRDDFNRINTNFQQILKEPLKDGIKILFRAKVAFDPSYGLSLWITDIDPGYTLGDLEREKQETIKRLRAEDIYNSNKMLPLPLLPQRIAIISVETSKGYADFLKVIETNPWNYKFFHLLFPSLLQGDNAVRGILAQLKRIKKVKRHFDVVAIIRGGGGDVGLSCYNDYQLARGIALFPLPVITGIGHATNETVSEMISFSNAITPTKLAEYLLQKFHNFSVPVREAERKVADHSGRLLQEAATRFRAETKLFRSVTENILSINRNEVKGLSGSLLHHARFIFKNEHEYLRTAKSAIIKETNLFCIAAKQKLKSFAHTIQKDTHAQLNRFQFIIAHHKEKLISRSEQQFKSNLLELNNMEKNVENMSPSNVLKRGYSITLLHGKAVKSITQVKAGDTLNTALYEGNITSIVNPTNLKTDQ